MFIRSMQGNLFIVLAKLLFKGNIAWHWFMSRRYLIVIENNKMFVAWWMNPFNIDMEGVAT